MAFFHIEIVVEQDGRAPVTAPRTKRLFGIYDDEPFDRFS